MTKEKWRHVTEALLVSAISCPTIIKLQWTHHMTAGSSAYSRNKYVIAQLAGQLKTTVKQKTNAEDLYSGGLGGSPYLSLLNTLGRYLLGNHIAMAHMRTHRMASSSSIWPRKLRVAWKYVDPMPERNGKKRQGLFFKYREVVGKKVKCHQSKKWQSVQRGWKVL